MSSYVYYSKYPRGLFSVTRRYSFLGAKSDLFRPQIWQVDLNNLRLYLQRFVREPIRPAASSSGNDIGKQETFATGFREHHYESARSDD